MIAYMPGILYMLGSLCFVAGTLCGWYQQGLL